MFLVIGSFFTGSFLGFKAAELNEKAFQQGLAAGGKSSSTVNFLAAAFSAEMAVTNYSKIL